MDYVNDHLNKHRKIHLVTDYGTYYENAPRFKCADGFEVSIQASASHYCSPRVNNMPRYSAVELGYPSRGDELIQEYAEDRAGPPHWFRKLLQQLRLCKPTPPIYDTVYGRVPTEVVNALIEKHGGPHPTP